MKKRLLLLVSILAMSVANLFANNDHRYSEMKNIKKNFQCSQDVDLVLSNKYGNINIEQWSRNEVGISVDITVEANSEKEVNRILNLISIEFKSSRSRVSAATILNNLMANNANFSILYHVFVPLKASMNITNKYGNVLVDQCNGYFVSELKFGNLQIGKLNSTDVSMVSKYGDIKIDEGKSDYAKINIAYGNVAINSITNLDITSKYGGFNAKNVGNLQVSSSYDNYNIENCSTIHVSVGGYSKFKIDKLKTSFIADDGVIRYGEVKIGGITSQLKQIKLDCSYTDVSLKFVERGDYNFDLFTSYGNIKANEMYGAKFDLTITSERNTTVGTSKSRSAKSLIYIKNRYGDIKLN